MEWAIGNTDSDAEAFASVIGPGERRLMYRFDDAQFGSTRFDDYSALVPLFAGLPTVCP